MLEVDTRAFGKFARSLKKAEPELARGLRTSLRAAGEIVAADARDRASFSSRIPGTVRVRTSGARVTVIAGGPNAPHAKPIENDGKGYVRHPVFGHMDVWTAKNSRPAFLHPAFNAHKEEARAAVQAAVTDTLRALGGEF